MRLLLFLVGAYAAPIILFPPTWTTNATSMTATYTISTTATNATVNTNSATALLPKSTYKPHPTPTSFFTLVHYPNARLCLGADTYDGAPALLLPCSDRRTTLRRAGAAIEFANGFCLDVTDGVGPLQAWTCVGNANQEFGWMRERSAVAMSDTIGWRGLCMGVGGEGGSVGMMPCSGGMEQRWIGLDSATGW